MGAGGEEVGLLLDRCGSFRVVSGLGRVGGWQGLRLLD